ncbi:MAG: 50S ribosomal protein L21 [Anaerolineales bacterium]|nr:50S ribosomal protein L21 [Chloroflexota bacterium]MBL6983535.1 50S ribosomal protein L21 [Anaerolineales bacterium]
MSYAIFDNGGKQYKAVPGEAVNLDRMSVEEGTKINFDQVLLVSDDGKVQVGTPTVKGAKVQGVVEEHFKAKKIIVFKYIPSKRYRRTKGHRQQYTRVRIDKIVKK